MLYHPYSNHMASWEGKDYGEDRRWHTYNHVGSVRIKPDFVYCINGSRSV